MHECSKGRAYAMTNLRGGPAARKHVMGLAKRKLVAMAMAAAKYVDHCRREAAPRLLPQNDADCRGIGRRGQALCAANKTSLENLGQGAPRQAVPTVRQGGATQDQAFC
ncbi:hypothetical protein C2134_13880 [Chromobacterium sinusclupearum]|uniref:Uncharacterized protein n=1 Tax=Chromobacterium sinusclupearum TaxID=2077146 RepID=A0A2K4MLT1_9NEIS|nr:hypothetical protein C2134_13880 [Chromobacterium sinusclupearum]